MPKVYMHSLGCAKNTVNSEQMLAQLELAGYDITADPAEADAAIVNTCGFIDSAKLEAIDAILQLARLKTEGKLKVLLAAGCLAERYRDQVMLELPELDGVLGVGSLGDIAGAVDAALSGARPALFAPNNRSDIDAPRKLLTPGYWAWLRIAEGCDNRCAYCAIPSIRGPFRSRDIESIVHEAETLANAGVKELLIIAQDTTRYGLDIYGKLSLAGLLRWLRNIDGIEWLRIHYLYPDEIDDELLETIAESSKVLKYFDIPIQHISTPVLARMNRRGDGGLIRERIARIRELMPDAIIRTSLIVGFPGETAEDFEELCAFLRQFRLERVGAFCYSQEEGTDAAQMPGQVPEDVKQERLEQVYAIQQGIMQQHAAGTIGRTLKVLCCGTDELGRCYGRSYMDSPDVDGAVYFEGGREGEFALVDITEACECDFFGKLHLE